MALVLRQQPCQPRLCIHAPNVMRLESIRVCSRLRHACSAMPRQSSLRGRESQCSTHRCVGDAGRRGRRSQDRRLGAPQEPRALLLGPVLQQHVAACRRKKVQQTDSSEAERHISAENSAVSVRQAWCGCAEQCSYRALTSIMKQL